MGPTEPSAGTPSERLERELSSFRARHPPRQVGSGEAAWSYLSGGAGTETLLLLPGALGADFSFRLVTALERELRVLVPLYPRTSRMAEVADGLADLLDREEIPSAHVLGGSFGGLIAQAFVRRHPGRVRSLVLSHTVAPDPERAQRNARAFWLVRRLPEPLLKLLFRKKLAKALAALPPMEKEFWLGLLRREVEDTSKTAMLDRANLASDWMRASRYTPDDLADWPGRILILEGGDDPFAAPAQQAALRELYPRAAVHRFEGTGHGSSLVRTDEFAAVVLRFLGSSGE